MNLSFAGCGFLGIYHVGVVSCFKEYAPNLINRLSGASAGAIAACCLICDCPLGQITSDALKIATTARTYTLGPFNPKFDVVKILKDRLQVVLPHDAHKRCSKRLRVSVTRVSDGSNVILDEFHTKQELIQALVCSSFIPIFAGYIPPSFRGVRYIDGCYSDNLPILDDNTITVSPFCGESDICPRDNSYNLLQVNLANTSIELSAQNLYRFMRVLFPPHPEILSQMCKQGFDDALRFLQRHDLIACTRCIAIHSTLQFSEQEEEEEKKQEAVVEEEKTVKNVSIMETGSSPAHSLLSESRIHIDSLIDEENCWECRQRRQGALLDDLPEAVLTVLEDACASMNKGLINWVFKHKTMRVLSVLTLPYVLPLDIAYVIFVKFLDMAPKLGNDLVHLAQGLVEHIKNIIRKVNKHRHFYSAKFTCQLAITEYDYEADDVYSIKPTPRYNPSSSPPSVQVVRHQPLVRHRSLSQADIIAARRASAEKIAGSRVIGRVNFGFTVDLASAKAAGGNGPLTKALGAEFEEEAIVDLANAALQFDSHTLEKIDHHYHEHRDDKTDCPRTDTFEQVLEATSKQDALMAYYYLDENNQMKVTEIFDVTDADTKGMITPDQDTNQELSWDSWHHTSYLSSSPCSSNSSLRRSDKYLDHRHLHSLSCPNVSSGADVAVDISDAWPPASTTEFYSPPDDSSTSSKSSRYAVYSPSGTLSRCPRRHHTDSSILESSDLRAAEFYDEGDDSYLPLQEVTWQQP